MHLTSLLSKCIELVIAIARNGQKMIFNREGYYVQTIYAFSVQLFGIRCNGGYGSRDEAFLWNAQYRLNRDPFMYVSACCGFYRGYIRKGKNRFKKERSVRLFQ